MSPPSAPIAIPGSSVADESGQQQPPKQQQQQQQRTARSRSASIAYPRQDADGNAHHLPPDWASFSRSPLAASLSGSSGASAPGSSILSLLGLKGKIGSPASDHTATLRHSHTASTDVANPANLSSSLTTSSSADSVTEAVTPPQNELSSYPPNDTQSKPRTAGIGKTAPPISEKATKPRKDTGRSQEVERGGRTRGAGTGGAGWGMRFAGYRGSSGGISARDWLEMFPRSTEKRKSLKQFYW